jgi:hypothetical protein
MKKTIKLLLWGGLGAILGNLLWVMRGVYECNRRREKLEIGLAYRKFVRHVLLDDVHKAAGLMSSQPYQDYSQN